MTLAALRGIKHALIPLIALTALAAGLAACTGSTGPAGPPGANGTPGTPGTQGPPGPGTDAVASTKPESCGTCHANVGSQGHQATYKQYVDPTTLVMTFTSVTSAANGSKYDVTLNFTLTQNGLPYLDANKLPSLLQHTFYAVAFNSANRQFHASTSLSNNSVVSNGDGSYTLKQTGFAWDPTNPSTADCTPIGGTGPTPCDGAFVYGYVARDLLNVESYTPATHYQLYANMSSAALPFGTAAVYNAGSNPNAYESNADVAACQGCHGTPYRKHGYREAIVGNGVVDPTTAPALPTFAACKACHYDDRTGSDKIWQVMVDDPLNWAVGLYSDATPQPAGTQPYPAKYNYTANIMNDVHMSHSMEFAYPQSMAVCSTCHKGSDAAGNNKLDNVRADAFFSGATCRSCHPVTNNTAAGYPAEAKRAPSLQKLWDDSGTAFHYTPTPMDLSNGPTATDCTTCHSHAPGHVATPFDQIHTGYAAPINYNAAIRDANGLLYSQQYGAKIDSATVSGTCSATSTSGCLLDIVFEPVYTAPGSATAGTIVPTVAVSFYGYNTKDFLISRHTEFGGQTATSAGCPDYRGLPGYCTLEYQIGLSGNPLFTEVTRTDGKWEVTVDLAKWVPPTDTTGTIPAEIAAGRITKAEITVQPATTVTVGSPPVAAAVAVDAVSQTFDVTPVKASGGALATWPDYFKDANKIVDVAKCNKCHDALGPTFHGGEYGGNITLCRSCHVPTSGAFVFEGQSRSFESYVHAIHSFQGWSTGSIDFTDPVAAKRYASWIEHIFPNFTTKNCEGCHVTSSFMSGNSADPAPTYEVPDQSRSMPGLLSGSDTLQHGWYVLDANGNYAGTAPDRNISGVPTGIIPSYMTGPASRDCGGCHRAKFFKEDDVGGLVSFNQHTNMGGYMVDTSKIDTTWTSVSKYVYGVIDHIMSMF